MRYWPDEESEVFPPELTLEPEPNPVVAMLLEPDGQPVSLLYERPRVAFGFRPGRKEPSRIKRVEVSGGAIQP